MNNLFYGFVGEEIERKILLLLNEEDRQLLSFSTKDFLDNIFTEGLHFIYFRDDETSS